MTGGVPRGVGEECGAARRRAGHRSNEALRGGAPVRTVRLAGVIAVGIGLMGARDLFLLPLPFLLDALTDEPAHAATALLSVGAGAAIARRRLARMAAIVALLGGTLIDLDHLPAILGWDGLTAGTQRPYSHSLLTVAAISLIAWRLRGGRRAAALVIAGAVSSHLMRDMATGGVPLLWPFPPDNVTIPYGVSAATLATFGVAVVIRETRRAFSRRDDR